MKRVGIITSALSSGHAIRGIGFYTRGLLSELHYQAKDFDIKLEEISVSSPGFDLIHYPFFDLFTHSLPIRRAGKTIVTIHDVIPLQFPANYPLGVTGNINLYLQKLALTSVSSVITDSYASVKEIHNRLGVSHSKIKLVYLAPAPNIHRISDNKLLASVKAKFKLPKQYILCVNDVNYNKNIVNLVKVSQQLRIPLILVGKQATELEKMNLDHPELIHLKELTPFLSSPLFIRPGFVTDDELSCLYTLAAVYCHTSFAEGFGIGVANALCCGCPVVCSDSSCLPEVAGPAAEYADPYSMASIAGGITKILDNSLYCKQLVKAGYSQIQNFSWKKSAAQTLEVYSQVLSV